MSIIFPGDEKGVVKAASLIKSGNLVGLPTETVYGLAANALNFDAVAEIFRVKGRPATNPVIVHVHSVEMAQALGDFNERAAILAKTFWPGPLTIVIRASEIVPTNVTAGGTTVGVRMPNHVLALKVLQASSLPIAAPSANRSEGISPTTANEVVRSLGAMSPPVLDGGACIVGIESTVVDVSDNTVRILRPGAVTKAQIESALDEQILIGGSSTIARSPGQMLRHYAPNTPALLIDDLNAITVPPNKLALLAYSAKPLETIEFVKTIRLPADPSGYASGLYAALSELDQAGVDRIVIETPPKTEPWTAVLDRLNRAVAPVRRD